MGGVLYYGHEIVGVYMNSEHLSSYTTSAQDQGNIVDGPTSKPQPLLRSYWQVIVVEEGESYFFMSVAICNSSKTSE